MIYIQSTNKAEIKIKTATNTCLATCLKSCFEKRFS